MEDKNTFSIKIEFFYDYGETICILTLSKLGITCEKVGRAKVHPVDRFDYVTGQKLSLKRALDKCKFTDKKDSRTKIWKYYLKHHIEHAKHLNDIMNRDDKQMRILI
jgi:hypothetical protein